LFNFLLRNMINNLKMGSIIFELTFLFISLSAILRFIVFIVWRHFMNVFKFVVSSIIEVIIIRGIIFFVKLSNLLRNDLWRRRILIWQPKFLVFGWNTMSFSCCIWSIKLWSLIVTIYTIIPIWISSWLFKLLTIIDWSHGIFSYLVNVLLFWSHLRKTWPQKTTNILLFGIYNYIAFLHFVISWTF